MSAFDSWLYRTSKRVHDYLVQRKQRRCQHQWVMAEDNRPSYRYCIRCKKIYDR